MVTPSSKLGRCRTVDSEAWSFLGQVRRQRTRICTFLALLGQSWPFHLGATDHTVKQVLPCRGLERVYLETAVLVNRRNSGLVGNGGNGPSMLVASTLPAEYTACQALFVSMCQQARGRRARQDSGRSEPDTERERKSSGSVPLLLVKRACDGPNAAWSSRVSTTRYARTHA